MEDSSFCVTVGKCSGTVYRAITEQSELLGRRLGGVARSLTDELRLMWLRAENLMASIRNDSQLAHWEMKRRDDFARLGEELFERRKEELEAMYRDDDYQEIIGSLCDNEKRIGRIRDDRTARFKRMREATVFRHALAQLRSPEPRIRRAAMRIIEKIGRPEASAAVARLLQDPDTEVRVRAREALLKLSRRQDEIEVAAAGEEEANHD
jgi:hypothetical protein